MPTDLRISNELLSDDVQRLFDSTEAFRCADLGTSSCVLAAAAGVDNEREFVEWCSLLQSGRQYFPATTTSAFNDLILGPPVILIDKNYTVLHCCIDGKEENKLDRVPRV